MTTSTSDPDSMFELMVDHLCHSVQALFADYGLPVERSHTSSVLPQTTDVSGIAVIGYAGEQVRGALVMTADEHATRAWLAAVGVPDGECADTLGEFSNMLLGRLKSRLLEEGCLILLTTPTTASGSSLRLSVPPPQAQSNALVFGGPGWHVGVRLDATFEPGFQRREKRAEDRAVEAGAGLLF